MAVGGRVELVPQEHIERVDHRLSDRAVQIQGGDDRHVGSEPGVGSEAVRATSTPSRAPTIVGGEGGEDDHSSWATGEPTT